MSVTSELSRYFQFEIVDDGKTIQYLEPSSIDGKPRRYPNVPPVKHFVK